MPTGGVLSDFLHDPLVWRGAKVAVGLLLVLVGIPIGRRLTSLGERVMLRARVDRILAEFLRNAGYAIFLALLVTSALDVTGFPTKSLLAALGAVGLAIGLALKDSVAHIAAGVILILLRPFRVGDSVNIGGHDGVVEGLFIMQTRLHTFDNRELVFMNGAVIAAPIVNYSKHSQRRSDLTLLLSHLSDSATALSVAKEIVSSDPRILLDPAPFIAIGDINERGIALIVQVWSDTGVMVALKSDLLVTLQQRLAACGIGLSQAFAPRQNEGSAPAGGEAKHSEQPKS